MKAKIKYKNGVFCVYSEIAEIAIEGNAFEVNAENGIMKVKECLQES